MKKLAIALAITFTLVFMLQVAAPKVVSAAPNKGAATILSVVLPGTGEWYNDGFNRAFPWVECIVGAICPCVMFSSAIDAAAGDTSDALRLDFWSAPAVK